MAIFSAYNLIRALTGIHLTLAYVALTTPEKLATHPIVTLFGESMGFVWLSLKFAGSINNVP